MEPVTRRSVTYRDSLLRETVNLKYEEDVIPKDDNANSANPGMNDEKRLSKRLSSQSHHTFRKSIRAFPRRL